MPTALHDKLKAEAERKFPDDKARQNAYVYGTLRKIRDERKAVKHA